MHARAPQTTSRTRCALPDTHSRARTHAHTHARHAHARTHTDEIDAIGGSRNPKDQQYMKMTLNQLLVELDGCGDSHGHES